MKRNTTLGIASLLLIMVFAIATACAIFAVSAQSISAGANLTLDVPNSIGSGKVDTPLTRRQLEKKYAKYNTVTQENGKTAVTVFTAEQIADFCIRRDAGEWFWLSTGEMLFLIEDTVRLFEEYDLVYIRGLDGVVHKYYGLSFYSSDAYFASFGGFDLGVSDASFDMKQDLYETLAVRISALDSAVYYNSDYRQLTVFTDLARRPTESEQEKLKKQTNPWNYTSELSQANPIKQFGAWMFYNETVYYTHVTRNTTSFRSVLEAQKVFDNASLPDGISPYKYDAFKKSVVIELYEEESETLIARIRLDDDEVAQAERLLTEFAYHYGSPGNATQEARYRALLYYSGMPLWFSTDDCGAVYYCPDGDLTLCSVYGTSGNSLKYDLFHFSDFDKAAEFLNGILKDRL